MQRQILNNWSIYIWSIISIVLDLQVFFYRILKTSFFYPIIVHDSNFVSYLRVYLTKGLWKPIRLGLSAMTRIRTGALNYKTLMTTKEITCSAKPWGNPVQVTNSKVTWHTKIVIQKLKKNICTLIPLQLAHSVSLLPHLLSKDLGKSNVFMQWTRKSGISFQFQPVGNRLGLGFFFIQKCFAQHQGNICYWDWSYVTYVLVQCKTRYTHEVSLIPKWAYFVVYHSKIIHCWFWRTSCQVKCSTNCKESKS